MADTAIPIPDDLEARIAALGRQIQKAADQLTRALGTTAHDARRGIQALGKVWREHEERSAQHQRVHNLMPTLTVRGVLVHGYVALKKA